MSGALVEETYPSGRKVKNSFQVDGALGKVETQPSGGSYTTRADNFTYTAAGMISSMQFGNAKWENAVFNSRLQPTQLGLGTSSSDQSLWKVNYDYGTTDNNGNVKSQTITVPTITAIVQNYTYDSLNRIKDATETVSSSTIWKQTFDYDRFGNRRFDTTGSNTTTIPGGCSTAQCNPTIDTSNNRFTTGQGYTYDSSGNLLTDAEGRTFTYDAENKQKTVSNSGGTIGTYYYDGDGKRVKKVSATETTLFVYDASGKLVAEYLLTEDTPSTPATSYLTNDTLGSPRVITDSSGNIESRRDFMPFGEEISAIGGRTSGLGYQVDAVRQKFTGYERDDETELDFAQARMYSNKLGRFSSSDPLLNSGRPNSPKTWNRYAYALNNPLVYIDPTGLYEFSAELGGNSTDDQLRANAKTDEEKANVENVIRQRDKFRRALTALTAAANDSSLTSKERMFLKRSLNSYGTFGDGNGVIILIDSGSVQTNGNNPNGQIGVFLNENSSAENMLLDVAHEGSHVADWQGFNNDVSEGGNPWGGPTKYETERDAYNVSSAIAKHLNATWGYNSPEGVLRLWNPSWNEVDKASTIDAIVKLNEKVTKDSPGLTFGEIRAKYHPQYPMVPH